MPQYMPMAAFLGTTGLLFFALTSTLELFLFITAVSAAMLCSVPHASLDVALYGGYILLPVILLGVYRKFIPLKVADLKEEERKKIPSMFHILIAFFNMMTFLFGLFGSSLWEGKRGALLFMPGIASIWTGSLLSVILLSWAKKLKIPLNPSGTPFSFQTSIFDYWWIVICQLGLFIFQGEDQLIFGNMLLVGLLPFIIGGISKLQEGFGKKRSPWLRMGISLLGIFLVFPLGCVMIFELIQPWIRRKENHGNC